MLIRQNTGKDNNGYGGCGDDTKKKKRFLRPRSGF
jgi:hypothetical protein